MPQMSTVDKQPQRPWQLLRPHTAGNPLFVHIRGWYPETRTTNRERVLQAGEHVIAGGAEQAAKAVTRSR